MGDDAGHVVRLFSLVSVVISVERRSDHSGHMIRPVSSERRSDQASGGRRPGARSHMPPALRGSLIDQTGRRRRWRTIDFVVVRSLADASARFLPVLYKYTHVYTCPLLYRRPRSQQLTGQCNSLQHNKCTTQAVFTVRLYTGEVYHAVVVHVSVRLTACLSVTSRHCTKVVSLRSREIHSTITQGLYLRERSWWNSPQTGRQIQAR